MEFDIKRVYSAVNADELKVGSKVIVAYNLGVLKNNVLSSRFEGGVLQDVKSEFENARFVMGNGYSFPLAYLVEEPEEKKLKWTDLKIGDVIRNKELPFIKYLITGIDECARQVFFCNSWTKSDELEQWEKVVE